jgi:hypothetical protein
VRVLSGGDRDRSLRAASLVYKYGRPKPPSGTKPLPGQLLDEMTQAELLRFAEHREWPARFAPRLRACGWTVSASAATRPNAEAPNFFRELVLDRDVERPPQEGELAVDRRRRHAGLPPSTT